MDGRDGRGAKMGALSARSAAAAGFFFVAIAIGGAQVAMAVDRPPLPYDFELDNATYLLVRAPTRAARRADDWRSREGAPCPRAGRGR